MIRARFSSAGIRIVYGCVVAVGVAVFVAAVAWPTVAILWSALRGVPSSSDDLFGSRQLTLLARTMMLSAAATLLAHVLAVCVVFCSWPRTGLMQGRVWLAPLIALLACPPFAYAFGWDKLLPMGWGGYVRCVWTWGLWAWPVPALILSTGLRRIGVGPFQAALLDAGYWRAVCHVTLPMLRGYAAFSLLIVFVFLFHEYSVPHAFGLQVFATELLTVMASSSRLVDALIPAALPVAATGVMLALALAAWRRLVLSSAAGIGPSPAFYGRRTNVMFFLVVIVSWLVPLFGLGLRLGSIESFSDAIGTYGGDIASTLGVAVGGGVLSVLMGMGVSAWRLLGRVCAVWALALGTLPGALVGAALIAAYNVEAAAPLFDHWPIIMLGHCARFGWVGVILALVLTRAFPATLREQARLDGASTASIFFRVRLPGEWPFLAAGLLIISVLSLGDIATTTLLRVPDFSPVAIVVIEKFHRFEDGLLSALCLILVGSGVTASIVVSAMVWIGRSRLRSTS